MDFDPIKLEELEAMEISLGYRPDADQSANCGNSLKVCTRYYGLFLNGTMALASS